MTIFVLGEPEFETSNWYKHILDGIINEKRAKRFTLILLNNAEELKSIKAADDDILFIIGTNSIWLESVISIAEPIFDNKTIVLGNFRRHDSEKKYSIVTSDLSRDIKILYEYLKSYGKEKIALYGINPESASDTFRKESFLACGASESDLFYNFESLMQCFSDFKASKKKYDGIICVNDYAAISLIKHLGEKNLPSVTSCGGSLISKFFTPSITTIKTDYERFAKSALELCHMLRKNIEINSVDIYVSGIFIPGETTNLLPLKNSSEEKNSLPEKKEDNFYSDTETDEMIRIEKLLSYCDDVDFKILKFLTKNYTYQAIASELFMSENGIKYKLKNMFDILKVKSKTEFLEIFNHYIQL